MIAIDGKTLRRSHDWTLGKNAIHMVSAWASANHLALAQRAVEAKSNEIRAIPALLLAVLDIAFHEDDCMSRRPRVASKRNASKPHGAKTTCSRCWAASLNRMRLPCARWFPAGARQTKPVIINGFSNEKTTVADQL